MYMALCQASYMHESNNSEKGEKEQGWGIISSTAAGQLGLRATRIKYKRCEMCKDKPASVDSGLKPQVQVWTCTCTETQCLDSGELNFNKAAEKKIRVIHREERSV